MQSCQSMFKVPPKIKVRRPGLMDKMLRQNLFREAYLEQRTKTGEIAETQSRIMEQASARNLDKHWVSSFHALQRVSLLFFVWQGRWQPNAHWRACGKKIYKTNSNNRVQGLQSQLMENRGSATANDALLLGPWQQEHVATIAQIPRIFMATKNSDSAHFWHPSQGDALSGRERRAQSDC